jgi:hypothetical protein
MSHTAGSDLLRTDATSPERLRQSGTVPTQPTPYAIQASSELSDDTFATSGVLIDADDRILPFVNPSNDNLVEALVMTRASERPQQPGIIDYIDIICPILENLLLMPGRDNTLIWNGLPTDTNLPGLIAPAILTALITPVFKIAQKAQPEAATTNPNVIPYYGDAPAEANPLSQFYGPIVSMIASIGSTIMSAWYAYKNASSTGSEVEAILGPVLGNASNMASPLTTWWVNSSTEDIPLIVKMIIDAVGDFGAGGVYAASIPS